MLRVCGEGVRVLRGCVMRVCVLRVCVMRVCGEGVW